MPRRPRAPPRHTRCRHVAATAGANATFTLGVDGGVLIGGEGGFDAALRGYLDTKAREARLRVSHKGNLLLLDALATPAFDGDLALGVNGVSCNPPDGGPVCLTEDVPFGTRHTRVSPPYCYNTANAGYPGVWINSDAGACPSARRLEGLLRGQALPQRLEAGLRSPLEPPRGSTAASRMQEELLIRNSTTAAKAIPGASRPCSPRSTRARPLRQQRPPLQCA